MDDRFYPDTPGTDHVVWPYRQTRRRHPVQHHCHRVSRPCKSLVAVPGTFPGEHCPVPVPGLSPGYDPPGPRGCGWRIYCVHIHPSHVDELSSEDPGLADTAGKERGDQRTAHMAAPANTVPDQHALSHCAGHGI